MTDNIEDPNASEMLAVKQETVQAPTGPSDTDAEVEAICERICCLEKKKRLAALLRQQQEIEKEVNSKSAEPTSERSSRSKSPTRERRRHRHWCHSLSSDERTPSRERRARSKWSVNKFKEERKDVKKKAPFELIEASCVWVVDRKDVDADSLIGFIKHICYIAGKAKSGRFVDAAHVNYDLAVRKLAFSDGFKAFSADNLEIALKYNAFEFMKKPSSMTAPSNKPGVSYQKLFTRDMFRL